MSDMGEMNSRNWKPTVSGGRWTSPEGEEIWTKIHDERGERNVAKLTRKGNLWYTGTPIGVGMYVYYTPTHWSPT